MIHLGESYGGSVEVRHLEERGKEETRQGRRPVHRVLGTGANRERERRGEGEEMNGGTFLFYDYTT